MKRNVCRPGQGMVRGRLGQPGRASGQGRPRLPGPYPFFSWVAPVSLGRSAAAAVCVSRGVNFFETPRFVQVVMASPPHMSRRPGSAGQGQQGRTAEPKNWGVRGGHLVF